MNITTNSYDPYQVEPSDWQRLGDLYRVAQGSNRSLIQKKIYQLPNSFSNFFIPLCNSKSPTEGLWKKQWETVLGDHSTIFEQRDLHASIAQEVFKVFNSLNLPEEFANTLLSLKHLPKEIKSYHRKPYYLNKKSERVSAALYLFSKKILSMEIQQLPQWNENLKKNGCHWKSVEITEKKIVNFLFSNGKLNLTHVEACPININEAPCYIYPLPPFLASFKSEIKKGKAVQSEEELEFRQKLYRWRDEESSKFVYDIYNLVHQIGKFSANNNKIHLEKLKITNFPPIFNLGHVIKHLKELIFISNTSPLYFTYENRLPQGIEKLENLEKLRICNQYFLLDCSILPFLPSLKTLDYSYNYSPSFDLQKIKSFTNLEKLILRGCDLVHFSSVIEGLPALKKLVITPEFASSLSSKIKWPENFKTLVMSDEKEEDCLLIFKEEPIVFKESVFNLPKGSVVKICVKSPTDALLELVEEANEAVELQGGQGPRFILKIKK